jgi:hypothetical protein
MTRIVREMGEDDGIRSYGPGKFHTVIDNYAYELTLDGGADEEATYPQEGSGWFGLVRIDSGTRDAIRKIAEENKDELTDEEDDLLEDSVAVLLYERSDGLVEADWFDSEKDADEAWADVLADTEGEEEEED